MPANDVIYLPAQAAGFSFFAGNIAKGTGDTISVPEGMVNIGGNGKGYLLEAQSSINPLTAANRDSSFTAFALAQNYYVYACQQASGKVKILFSINSTYPAGTSYDGTAYSASNTRKIGGFHYGRVRNSFTVADVTNGAIVPNSVWDLANRPSCDPAGMVRVGNIWVDIYLASVNAAITFSAGNGSPTTAGSTKSAYNATPLTGTEGLSGYSFNELAMRTGKRMLSMNEWLAAAHGSPQGNNGDNVNAWSATTNGGRAATGSVVNAISISNAVDCVGNVLEWLDEYTIRRDVAGAWAWQDVMSGQGVGQLYMYSNVDLVQIISGGHWGNGAHAGSRCVNLYSYPWDVNPSIGSRFACDSL